MNITDKLPAPVPASDRIVEQCVSHAARHFDINPLVVMSILKVEGGKVGTLSKNKNGTYDMGLMQINTIHLPEIKKKYPRVGWKELTYNPCVNIGVATAILNDRMKGSKDYWNGVGNYHSKTPKYREIYLKKVKRAYNDLVIKYKKPRHMLVKV